MPDIYGDTAIIEAPPNNTTLSRILLSVAKTTMSVTIKPLLMQHFGEQRKTFSGYLAMLLSHSDWLCVKIQNINSGHDHVMTVPTKRSLANYKMECLRTTMWQSQFALLAGEQWWRQTFFNRHARKRAYNQPSLSRWSPSGWHSRSDPLSSRFLHNKSVIILNKGGKSALIFSEDSQLVTLKQRVNWCFTSFSMSWRDLMWMSFNGEFRAWEGNRGIMMREPNGSQTVCVSVTYRHVYSHVKLGVEAEWNSIQSCRKVSEWWLCR